MREGFPTFRRVIAVLFLLGLLPGCVLQAQEPIPVVTAAEILADPAQFAGRQIICRGAVIHQVRQGPVFMESGERGLFVLPENKLIVRPNQLVEVSGFVATNMYSPTLSRGVMRLVPGEKAVLPTQVTVRALREQNFDAQFVKLRARLVNMPQKFGDTWFLNLSEDNHLFRADYVDASGKADLSSFLPGSYLEVAGVCSVGGVAGTRPAQKYFRLILRDPAEVRVLRRGSWLTVRRAMGLLAGVSGIAVIIGAWVITLNRKVRQQTITIRKQLETEAALEQFYQEILQKAQEGIWILNSDNRTSFINQKLCRLLETNEEELARKSFLDVVVKEDRAQAERMLREPLVQDLRLQGATGNELWALVSSTPFEMGKGNRAHCLLMFVDITSRKRAEAALEESESRYRALAENLETAVAERTSSLKKAIGDMEAFSYGISHDLRGPLRAMQGYSQILLEDHGKALSAEAQSYLERISKASQKLDRMIQDLLAYSRVASGEVRVAPVNVAGLVREILSEEPALRPFAECVELEQPLPALLAHGPSLRQVLVNLIGNAVKFKKEGEPPRIRLWAEQRNPLVRIHVQDQGIGIREQDRERIFSIFERADHRFEGTGIGLAIVKRSIEKMGGRVGLESTLGQGSDFWFELSPAATEGAEHPNKSFERS